MQNITIRLDEDMINELEAEADEHGKTRSEHIRDTLATRRECADEHTDYEERIAELEATVERLENEKRTLIRDREEKQELVRYVEDERTAEQRWRQAGMGTRAKWRLFGMPADGE